MQMHDLVARHSRLLFVFKALASAPGELSQPSSPERVQYNQHKGVEALAALGTGSGLRGKSPSRLWAPFGNYYLPKVLGFVLQETRRLRIAPGIQPHNCMASKCKRWQHR